MTLTEKYNQELELLITKRAAEVSVEPALYLNWLVNRMGEIANPLLASIEAQNDIAADSQAQVSFFDNCSSATHQIKLDIGRHPLPLEG